VKRFLLPAVILSVFCVVPAAPDDDAWEDDDREYDRARRAVSRGEMLPMADLLERVRTRFPGGEFVEVELEREAGRWIYEFKIIDGMGRLMEVQVDANNGRVLSVEDD
jgi:uncharacterized membrane protein YkoI